MTETFLPIRLVEVVDLVIVWVLVWAGIAWLRATPARLALAGLGLQSEAKEEADWLTRSRAYADFVDRGKLAEARAMIFAQAGFVNEALAEIEPLLAGPSYTSAHMLRLDPRYDPMRDDSHFVALLGEYEN